MSPRSGNVRSGRTWTGCFLHFRKTEAARVSAGDGRLLKLESLYTD